MLESNTFHVRSHIDKTSLDINTTPIMVIEE